MAVLQDHGRLLHAEGSVGGEGFAIDDRLTLADANRQTGGPGSDGLAPSAASCAAREYLAVFNDAAIGAATPVVPKYLAPADPASRRTNALRRPAFHAYSTNYLIDLDHAVITDVEDSTAVREAKVTVQAHDRASAGPRGLCHTATLKA